MSDPLMDPPVEPRMDPLTDSDGLSLSGRQTATGQD